MKKKVLCGMVLAMGLLVAAGQSNTADAKAKKNKVTYTVKKDVLTIKGKGKMPASWQFGKIKKAKKVKKVVVKKGVTSVSVYAFKNLKEVKTISVASSVKSIGRSAFRDCIKLTNLTIPGDFTVTGVRYSSESLDKDSDEANVTFNTKFNPEIAGWLNSQKLTVMKNDPKYTSVNGVVYSKDKKTLEVVPALMDKLDIIEGCTTVKMDSMSYCNVNGYGGCLNLRSIAFPASFAKIEDLKSDYNRTDVTSLSFRNKELTGRQIDMLRRNFPCMNMEKIKETFGDFIVTADEMVYTKDGVLLSVPTDKKEIVVPDNINMIGYGCFLDTKAESVKLPETLTEIAAHAFNGAYYLNNITIPASVKSIGNYAFSGTNLVELNIPATVSYVGSNVYNGIIHVYGSTNGFDPAFCEGAYEVSYEGGIENGKLFVNGSRKTTSSKASIHVYFSRIANVSGYEIQYSTKSNFKKPFEKKTVGKTVQYNNLTSKKYKNSTIYVRVRAFKKQDGKLCYSKWTTMKFKK